MPKTLNRKEPMKNFILIPLLMLMLEASSHAGWFTHDNHEHEQQLQQQLDHEQQRAAQLDQQFQQEHQHNTRLTAIVVVLSIGCVVTFVTGTMIGSKTRRAANEN